MDAAQKDKYVKLGLNIAYYRRLRKYTQLELCERLDIDRSYISKIELGNAGVSLDGVNIFNRGFFVHQYSLKSPA